MTGKHHRPKDSLCLQKLARDVGKRESCSCFLFDRCHADIIDDITDTFETGTLPVDTDKTQLNQKVALVYSGHMSEHEFMENVATNRGYALRVFDQIEAANEWLNSCLEKAKT